MGAKLPDDKKANEHLANERTFLAWIRTAVSIMSLGFVISKFGLWLRELASHFGGQSNGHSSGLSEPIGVGMIGVGGLLAILSAWRFHVVNRQIEAGRVKVDRALVFLITITVAVLAALMMVYVGTTAAAHA